MDYALCEDAAEEFLAVWNDMADQLAVSTNLHRGPEFENLLQRAEEFYTTFGSNDFRHYEASTCKSHTQPKKIKKSLISLMNPLL